MRLRMRWTDRERRLSLGLEPGSRFLPPTRRLIEVRVAGEDRRSTLVFEGRPIEVRL
ncbi:MAG: hypothetical protein Kow00109_23000 [Acidobacteriota bacterium]